MTTCIKILTGFVLSILLSIFVLTVPSVTKAEGEFLTRATTHYYVEESGRTKATYSFEIQNLQSVVYATNYSLTLGNISIENVSATSYGRELNTDVTKNGEDTKIVLNFDKPTVGKNKKFSFDINFENQSFVIKSGEIWEINIPKISEINKFESFDVSLSVPESFGNLAFITPDPVSSSKEPGRLLYYFGDVDYSKTGIVAGFGNFQVFSYTLNYHLENPLNAASDVEIAIPPDTGYQRVYYQSVEPKPKDVNVDSDGNWLAAYTLKPRERIDVVVKGSVQIFSSPRQFIKSTKDIYLSNLKANKYWNADDPKIVSLAKDLKTPKAIYDYVVTTLNYDYERVKPNVVRLGSIAALENPNNAICTEFTDLTIALMRAAGIPAREVNGYAYTENPKIQPLSLVADVLHAWPEYWDEERSAWIQIDPTWGSTTGGLDYFNKTDLRHFTLVIHGKDPVKPYPPGSYKLGPNPQKDVYVSLGKLSDVKSPIASLDAQYKRTFPFVSDKVVVRVENIGPLALYKQEIKVLFETTTVKSETLEVLPPYSSHEFYVDVPFSLFGQNIPSKISVVSPFKKIDLPTSRNEVLIYNILLFFVIGILISLLILLWIKKRELIAAFKKLRKH